MIDKVEKNVFEKILEPVADRHDGKDAEILTKRHQAYIEAKGRHPERLAGNNKKLALYC